MIWLPSDKEKFEICTVLPGYVVGPSLTDQVATSLDVVKRMMVGGDLMVPDVSFAFVDIRDIVDAHVTCMTSPKAPGRCPFLHVQEAAVSLIHAYSN